MTDCELLKKCCLASITPGMSRSTTKPRRTVHHYDDNRTIVAVLWRWKNETKTKQLGLRYVIFSTSIFAQYCICTFKYIFLWMNSWTLERTNASIVWSIPERFRGELLTMWRYTYLCIPLPFSPLHQFFCKNSSEKMAFQMLRFMIRVKINFS